MAYDMVGGFTTDLAQGGDGGGEMYSGPDWFTNGMEDISAYINPRRR
jgi:hypothetical protein